MDLAGFSREIRKTGFVFEFDVAQALRRHGWNVITNKHYVDDLQDVVREIDLIAYRTASVQNCQVYTTLILSCKKDNTHVWALLTRDVDTKDPNADWNPVHVWSNDKVLSFMTNEPGWREQYAAFLVHSGRHKLVEAPRDHVFAFQEMNRESGKPHNDTNIFASITSLMKAQAYELKALPDRRHDPALYQFNLLSVVDSDLVRLHFTGSDINPSIVDGATYFANYIIRKQQTSARIYFVKASSLEATINEFDLLHKANLEFFDSLRATFFRKIMADERRRNVLLPNFQHFIHWQLWLKLYRQFKIEIKAEDVKLSWSSEQNRVEIELPIAQEQIDALNGDVETCGAASSGLKMMYRYEGPIAFSVEGLPF
jgi:hypothetical protein